MHNLDLIPNLAGCLAAALGCGFVTHRLGLSPIVGYLAAGIVVGPQTPGFVANRELAEQLAEIGVVLLMFGVGLHFKIKELVAVWRIALPGAACQSLIATGLGAVAAFAFGWGWTAGIVFGLAISVASTVVLTRVLAENHELHTPVGHIAIGWLVVEDLLTVLVLVLLPAWFGDRQAGLWHVFLAVGLALAKVGALVAFTFLVGGRLIPWLLGRAAATRSRELFTLTILVVALGIAVGSAKVFGVSMALGAFLAGMIVGRSDFSLRAASEAMPMRDAFAVLFFVSVGMLFDPHHLLEAPGVVAATLVIIVLGKPLAALWIILFLRYPVRVALAVAVALSQIGEFTFILAAMGRQLGITSDSVTNTLVAAAIISISLNPLLYRLVSPFETWVSRQPRLWRWLNARTLTTSRDAGSEDEVMAGLQHRAIIVGYGPVGRTLTRLMKENGIEPTIIELNHETVSRLNADGVRALYGDAGHRDTLEAAGVGRATTLILSAAGIHGCDEIIRQARELNPKVRVLVRSTYLSEHASLLKVGASAVFSSDYEVALAMTEFVLRELGATPEQIDLERERLRTEFSGNQS